MYKEYSIMGKRLPRLDAIEKVKGEAKFTTDIHLPRMLHAKFLRSPHAHARIIRIDATKARELSGVKAVLTHKDVPKVHPLNKLEYLLDETVHYAGEEVAAVAAVTKEAAEEALKLIEIEYEVLSAVLDKEEAMKPDAPLVHPELGSNLYQCPRTIEGMLPLEWGDVEKGFSEADYIIEGVYESPLQHNVSPEPRSVLCEWTGDNLTCWASTQVPQAVRTDVAACLNIPLTHVRVISTYSVGGYGAKRPEKIAVLTALLAKETGRPVKAVFTRAEDFIATHRRIDAKIYARLGIKKTGTITALHTRMITNFGRDSVYGYLIPAAAAVDTCSMLYEYHNSKFEGYHVITNIEDHGAVNGFGDPEAGFCIERLIDEAAERINRDPVDFRLKNCMRYGDKGMDEHHVIYGPIEWGVVGPDIDSLQQCIRSVAERSRWKEKWKGWNTPVEAKGPRRRGIGVAIGMHHCIAHPPDSASVKMNQDGSAEVLSSNPEIGQGLKTGMAQVVAEVLGLHYRNVNVILADTSVTPYAPGVFGNRGTTAGIGAACAAAQDAKRQLLKIGAERLGVNIEELEAKQGTIRMTANPEKKVSLAELCQSGYQVTGHAVLPWPWIDERSGKKVAPVSVAATIAEVEVDSETGQIDVVSIVTAHDCGRAINPSIVENQIDMSITMGNGYARTERMLIDKKTGAIINPNLLDYKIMTILDMPKREDFQEIIVEVPMPWGPFGAKGMSETGTTTPAPAIANAIYNAIGIRIRGDHLTPESILESLGKVPMEAKCHDAL